MIGQLVGHALDDGIHSALKVGTTWSGHDFILRDRWEIRFVIGRACQSSVAGADGPQLPSAGASEVSHCSASGSEISIFSTVPKRMALTILCTVVVFPEPGPPVQNA